jgi:type II secretory pathway pseudopilin PulG
MAALLVALSIMAVMMTVAMPVWHQTAQREKEAELIFRGQQYARAIGLFERKYANTPPPDLDVLVREHFLRKKYKDPITNKDFVPIPAAQAGAATPGAIPGESPAATFQRNNAAATQPQTGAQPQRGAAPAIGGAAATVTGGIIGVTSSSKDKSIRIYNGATRYSDWRFVYNSQATAAGGGARGGATPGVPAGANGRGQGQGGPFGVGGGNRGGGGQRGGPGQGPGGPGRGPAGQPGPFGQPGQQGPARGGFGAPPIQGQPPFGAGRGR